MTKHGFYPRHRQDEVDPSPSFPTMEASTLAFWASDDTFRKSIEMRDAGEHGSNEFVFYDGPPFANGLPHYGHLLTGYVKDVVGRYQTMKGHRVERRLRAGAAGARSATAEAKNVPSQGEQGALSGAQRYAAAKNLARLERQLDKVSAQIAKLHADMEAASADPGRVNDLIELGKQLSQVQERQADIELEWLEAAGELEQ